MASARKGEKKLAPEEILAGHSPAVHELAEGLRQVIKEAVPEASEAAYPVWHAIGYRHPSAGYFCGIFPQADSVDLAFEYGVLLPDPGGLLKGKGKQVRYVHLNAGDPVPGQPIRDLIEAALSLPDGRKAKQELLRAMRARESGSAGASKDRSWQD
jgi:hypothetical protein